MFELDKACQAVIASIIEKQQEFSVGDSVVVAGCSRVKYQITKVYAPVQLKRIKQDYLNFCKL